MRAIIKSFTIAYNKGEYWAEEDISAAGDPAGLKLPAGRNIIEADGKDLSFITVKVIDENSLAVSTTVNTIKFEIKGPGKFIATDNGVPTDFAPFSSYERKSFSGLAFDIVRSISGEPMISQ